LFIEKDDSKSDPYVRDNFTTNLNPKLASQALNVSKIRLSWWIDVLIEESVSGINNTIHSVIASKYSNDINKCE